MKNLFYFFNVLVGMLGIAFTTQGQTSVTISAAGDTLPYHCGDSVSIEMYIYGTANGYTSSDSVEVYVGFGDGTDTLFKAELFGSDSAWFWTIFNHTYNNPGYYSTTYIVTGPDGKADTLNVINDIFINDTCITSVNIDWATDSIDNCSVSSNYFYISGQALNYSPGDSVDININFGDGNSINIGSGITSQGYFWLNHNYTYTAPGTYSIRYIVAGPDGKADTLYGQAVISNNCASISGTLYLDNNNDCIFNSADEYLSGIPVYLKSGSTIIATTYTDYSGNYYFQGISGTFYTVEIMYADTFYYGYYTPSCPASGSVTFTAGTSNINNFAFDCDDTAFDLQGNLWGWGFRPGFDGTVYMNVFNPKCLPVSGTATLTLDPLLTYIGISGGVAPTTSSGNTLTWNFTNLEKNFYWYSGLYSYIQVSTSLSAQLGDSVCLTLSITPTSGDANPANNIITECFEVRNSYDPNMKEVAPKGTGTSGDVVQDTDFTYRVHFQNTGNDIAYNIHIMDTIDEDLDMSTLRIISSSHNMNPYIIDGNVVKFDFPNIMLADSTSNEPASHGVVVYKIKAKPSLPYGTQFKNTAHIYFDFNPAIVTNTTVNTILWPLSVKEHSTETMEVFPNPTSGIIRLSFDKMFTGKLAVTDVLGKTVMLENVSGTSSNLDLSTLNAGIYTITANDGKASMQNKVAVFK